MNNQGLYNATKTHLLEGGAPEELAEKAATIVANDDSSKPDLGRSEDDKKIISEAHPYLLNRFK